MLDFTAKVSQKVVYIPSRMSEPIRLLNKHKRVCKEIKDTEILIEELEHKIKIYKNYLKQKEEKKGELHDVLLDKHGFLV